MKLSGELICMGCEFPNRNITVMVVWDRDTSDWAGITHHYIIQNPFLCGGCGRKIDDALVICDSKLDIVIRKEEEINAIS